MSKEQFLQQVGAAALPVHPVTVSGVSFFVRETSVMDVRIAMERKFGEAVTYRMARQLATVMLGESGQPLFDPTSDDDMATLSAALDALPGTFPAEVNKARAAFEKPITEEEVDTSGN